jgi:hypothetical protein
VSAAGVEANQSGCAVRLPPRKLLASAGACRAASGRGSALAKAARLPLVLAELLVARGVTQPAEAFAFLNPEPRTFTIPS